MTPTTDWREDTIQQLHDLLCVDPDVIALAIVGSGTHAGLDAWSDIDALLVIQSTALERFYPTLAWLEPLGRVYAVDQHRDASRAVSRVWFDDMRLVDVVITTESALQRDARWSQLPDGGGSRVLFSRTPALKRLLPALGATPPSPDTPNEAFQSLVN